MWDILASLGGAAAIIAIGSWLFNALLERLFNKQLERHKHELQKQLESHKLDMQKQFNIELEHFKNDLRASSFRHEKRFGLLHEEMFKAFKVTYYPLLSFVRSVNKYISPVDHAGEPDKDGKLKIVIEKLKEYRDTYDPVSILFPEALHLKMQELDGLLVDITQDFTFGRDPSMRSPGEKPLDFWKKALDRIKEKADPLLDDLRKEMKKLMGHEGLDATKPV